MKKITKVMKTWLRENGFECGCRLGREWLFEPNDNYICIPRVYDDTNDDDFMQCLKDLGLRANVNVFLMSFLHELGHYLTIDNFTDRQWSNVQKRISKIATIPNKQTRNFAYWNLKTEKVANEWAVDFANTHEHELNILLDKLISIC